ncbi:MAG: hypothetical protein ACLGIK_15235 [Gemmatimonadota bacterium]
MAILATLIALFLVGDVLLAMRYLRYRGETDRLRGEMTEAERQRTDMISASEDNRLSVMLELLRRQAAGDRELHLAVSVDSGTMLLERDGALLREMRVEMGGERVVGSGSDTVRIVAPRGARSVERILGPRDGWEVPAWLFADRGLAPPGERRLPGVLGANALVLSGGTVIYALPDSGVLADSGYVIPGAVRLSRADLRAIAPNITPGLTVYFYE